MAINPYQLVQSQLGLSEELIKQQQQQQQADIATSSQMGSMSKKFNEQLRNAEKRAEEQLRKKKKKSGFGKIANLISMFAGPIAGPIISALSSMHEMRGQSKHAEKQAKLAKAAALGVDTSRFSNTFLGEQAKDYKAQQESAFDKMIADTQIGTGDLLTQGLASGLTSMAMGKVGEKIKGGIGDIKAAKEAAKNLKAPSDIGVKIKDLGVPKIDASGAFQMPKVGEGAVSKIGFDPKMKVLDKSIAGIKAPTGVSNIGMQSTPTNLFGKMGRSAPKLSPEQLKLLDQGYLKNIFQQMKSPVDAGLDEGQTNFLQQLLMMFR